MDKKEKIKELEREVNEEIENLPLFRLSSESALIFLFKNFEDRCRFPIIAKKKPYNTESLQSNHLLARIGLDALNVLIPRIYEKCVSARRFNLKNDDKKYIYSGEAIDKASIYYNVKDALKLCHGGIYDLKTESNEVYFIPKKGSLDYDARAQLITWGAIADEADTVASNLSEAEVAAVSIGTTQGPQKLVRILKDKTFAFQIPREILNAAEVWVSQIIKYKWELDRSINLQGYTIADAVEVWASLLKIANIHTLSCLKSGLQGVGLDYLPILMHDKELINFIHKDRKTTSKSKIRAVVSDLTYGNKIVVGEVMWQPLFPLPGTDILIIVPNIIIFSNMERNFMKLWARLYPDIYGKKIASVGEKKEKILANRIKEQKANILTVSSKKIYKENGQTLTDLDVGAYDTDSEELLLIQLKWFLQPDSSHEVADSDKKLNDGLDQLRRVDEHIKSYPDVLQRIFGVSYSIKPRKIYQCVVSSSSIGSFWLNRIDTDIFSLRVFLDILNKQANKTFGELFKKLKKEHTFKRYIHYESVFQKYYFGSREFFLPATEPTHRNFLTLIIGYSRLFFLGILRGGDWRVWRIREFPTFFTGKSKQ